MTSTKWWQNAIVYQIYPRSFCDTDGDGVGDLRGIIDHLDYLNNGSSDSLGVDAIWLTPIYPSPLYDFGYDVANYEDIDPAYGTLDDFDNLVTEAHRRGIHVMMDLVANHTSHLHAWFQESRSSRDNPRRDWYIWRDPRPDGSLPNNWLSVFGGPAWEWDERTEQYYCHAFLREQPDLNWQNEEVRRAIKEVMRFWMQRGVGGFRVDAIAHIGKHPGLPDNPTRPNPLPTPDDRHQPEQEHLYDTADPDMHAWISELRATVDEFDAMLIGEIYGLRPETLASFMGDRQLNTCFNFDLLLSPWDARAFRAAVDSFAASLPPDVWPAPVLGNHDQPRSFSRYNAGGLGAARARVAAMMLLTLRGSPYIYYGEEIGMSDVAIPVDRRQDPIAKRFAPESPGRDPERTPMQWSQEQNAGFSASRPWLPVGEDYQAVNVAVEAADASSLLSLYRKLSALRRQVPALSHGSYRALDVCSDDVYAYIRAADSSRVIVALNLGIESRTVDLREAGARAAVLVTTSEPRDPVDLGRVHLPPTSGVVLRVDG